MRTPTLIVSFLVLSACSREAPPPVAEGPAGTAPASTSVPAATTPADAFFAGLASACGKAFGGALGAHEEGDLALFGGPPVMHVASCTADEIRIPFHVGENRSRTWIVTRTPAGLRLKHDHRHEDGTPDDLTMYGGDTAGATAGTAQRQEFPADAESKAMFETAGLTASVGNTWAIEVEPGSRFVYELRRPERHFSVVFDLTTPVAPPPPPWGASTPPLAP